MMDGGEAGLIVENVFMSKKFPLFDVEVFRKNLVEAVKRYTVFKLGYVLKNDLMHWVEIDPAEFDVVEVCDTVREWDAVIVREDVQWKENSPLYRVWIERDLKAGEATVLLLMSHMLCDGRTISAPFLTVCSAVPGEKAVEFEDAPLVEFGHESYFEGIDESVWRSVPECWNVPKGGLLPPLRNYRKGLGYCNRYLSMPYATARQFCKKHGVGLQAIVSACFTESIRRFNKLDREEVIAAYFPQDMRSHPNASERFRKQDFYCGVGAQLAHVKSKPTLLETIKHCQEKVVGAVNGMSGPILYLQLAHMIDPETGKMGEVRFPSLYADHLLFASNVGSLPGKIGYQATVFEEYFALAYFFTVGDTLYYMFAHPDSMDEALVALVMDDAKNMVEFIEANSN